MTTITDTRRQRRAAATSDLRVNLSRLRHLAGGTASSSPNGSEPGIDLKPGNAYEVVTRQMVESLADDLKEIKSRLNNLFFVIAGGILLDLIGKMLGIGT